MFEGEKILPQICTGWDDLNQKFFAFFYEVEIGKTIIYFGDTKKEALNNLFENEESFSVK